MNAPYAFSPAFADYDADGDLDLALGHWGTPRNSDISREETETLWRNDSVMGQISFLTRFLPVRNFSKHQ